MRFFVEVSYDGTNYSGWQRQANVVSIQQILEEALCTLLHENITIVGCGRTDAGVHALSSFFHYDSSNEEGNLKYRLNIFLPQDISVIRIIKVADDAHARYDAIKRSYIYRIHTEKDPFLYHRSFYFPHLKTLDFEKLQNVASILAEYSLFLPFCKTRTDVKTMDCNIFESRWQCEKGHLHYHITANRFLRGMVRLIVGMCLNVSQGKLDIEMVRTSLEKQSRLNRDLSVPACGLFLTEIIYPYIDKA